MTGLSGSGKSVWPLIPSMRRGQRRYVESLSAYARQFLGNMEKPDVDAIDGLSPAISIDQKTTSKILARRWEQRLKSMTICVSSTHVWGCLTVLTGMELSRLLLWSKSWIRFLELPERQRLQILAPVIRKKKANIRVLLRRFRKMGMFVSVWMEWSMM